MTPITLFGWALGIAGSAAVIGGIVGTGVVWFAFCGAEARRIWGQK